MKKNSKLEININKINKIDSEEFQKINSKN